MKPIHYIIGVLTLTTFVLGGCAEEPILVPSAELTKSIVASVYPFGYFAQEIAGERAHVTVVTPAGAEPHSYELSPGDIALMERSILIILSGTGFEPWAESIVQNFSATPGKILALTEQEAQKPGEEQKAPPDPHVWLSPIQAKEIVRTIGRAIMNRDPEHAAEYSTRLERLLKNLDMLHTAFETGLANCTTTTFVTSHDAFGYLAREYDLNQVALAGISPDEEPSPKRLAEIASLVKEKNVQYVFFESLISPKFSETIANETGVETRELNPIEGLSEAERKAGKDYFSLMRQNLEQLKIALGCEP